MPGNAKVSPQWFTVDDRPRRMKRTLCGQVVRRHVLGFEPMSLDPYRSDGKLDLGWMERTSPHSHLIRAVLVVAEAEVIEGRCEDRQIQYLFIYGWVSGRLISQLAVG